jgi:hypothetical protein
MKQKDDYDRFMQDLKNEKELNAFEMQSYEG